MNQRFNEFALFSAVAALGAGGIFCSAGGAWADRVVFKDGTTLETLILDQDDIYVIVKDGPARNRIPRSRIERVIVGSPADNDAIKAKAGLAAGKMGESLAALARAADQGADLNLIAAMLLAYDRRISAAAPALEPGDREAFRRLNAKLVDATDVPQADLLAARLRWSLFIKDGAGIGPTLEALQKHDPGFASIPRGELEDGLAAAADQALEAKNFPAAMDLIRNLKRLNREKASALRVEMALLWARSERDKGRFESALAIYADQLQEESPAISRDRIQVTLEDAEKRLRDSGELDKVIDLYERHGPAVDAEWSRKKLAALWQEVGWMLLQKGQIEMARSTFGRANSVEHGSADKGMLTCDYEESRVALKPDDHVGFFKLGEWCAGAGLTKEARESFKTAAQSGTLRNAALQEIEAIENIEAEKELHRLLDLYEAGQHVDLLRQVRAFQARRVPEGLAKQAADLERLTRDAMVANQLERPQQAEVLMQQAERAFWTGDHQSAYNLLKTLLESFADTPASARGLKFYRAIRKRLDLEGLEQRRQAAPNLDDLKDEYRSLAGSDDDVTKEIQRLREGTGRAAAPGKKAVAGARPDARPIADPDAAPGDPSATPPPPEPPSRAQDSRSPRKSAADKFGAEKSVAEKSGAEKSAAGNSGAAAPAAAKSAEDAESGPDGATLDKAIAILKDKSAAKPQATPQATPRATPKPRAAARSRKGPQYAS